jgi:hypothetical protein
MITSTLHLSREVWGKLTLRQLMQVYDHHLLTSWDPVSVIACMINNLQATLCNVNTPKGGKLVRPKSPNDFHPFRKKKKGDFTVNKSNFKTDMKLVGRMMKGSR